MFNTRKKIAYGFSLFSAGVIILLLKRDLSYYFGYIPFITITLGVLLMITGIMFFLALYIRGEIFKEDDLEIISTNKTVAKEIEEIRKEFQDILSQKLNEQKDTKDLDTIVKKRVDEITDVAILQKIEESFGTKIIDDAKIKEIVNDFDDILIRIRSDINRISRQGNINLIIGFFTTFIAVFLLGYTLYNLKIDYAISFTGYVYNVLPRLSLSILIELFSFFF